MSNIFKRTDTEHVAGNNKAATDHDTGVNLRRQAPGQWCCEKHGNAGYKHGFANHHGGKALNACEIDGVEIGQPIEANAHGE